ncbi:MAG: hypothetical protein Q8Q38_01500 [bacterium]|nr:hypothetical protein [bacterium]
MFVQCVVCKKHFSRKKSQVQEAERFGWRAFCSSECQSWARRRGKILVCERGQCTKTFYRPPNDISLHNYCSWSCAARVNNRKFPKRGQGFRFCAGRHCSKKFSGRQKYCSFTCRKAARFSYTKEEASEMIRKASEKLGRVPAKREVAFADACAALFGSWNNAVLAAGLMPNRSHDHRMYKRTNTKARDGHLCDSVSEALVDNWLANRSIAHKRNVPYPNTGHLADWSVGRGVFVEYFGLAKDSPRYDRSVVKKRLLCRQSNIQLIEIYAEDLYPKRRLQQKLRFLIPLGR